MLIRLIEIAIKNIRYSPQCEFDYFVHRCYLIPNEITCEIRLGVISSQSEGELFGGILIQQLCITLDDFVSRS